MNKEQMPPFCQTDVVCSTGNYLEFLQSKQQGKGYLTVKNFIKDFELTNASVSELEAESTSWTLTIVSGHKYQYFTGLNFGW